MPGKILVLGATGHVGAPLVTELVAAKELVKAASRHKTLVAGAEVVSFDYADQKSYQTAFDGVDRAFVLLPGGYTNKQQPIEGLKSCSKPPLASMPMKRFPVGRSNCFSSAQASLGGRSCE